MGLLTSLTSPVASTPTLTLVQREALCLLERAAEAAGKEGLDVWQFALEIGRLRALGLSHTDLRCLLRWDYLEHARELTASGADKRLFQALGSLTLPRRTCFVLTAKGRQRVSQYYCEKHLGVAKSQRERTAVPCRSLESPHWDGESRQLWWAKHLIKEFRRPAVNQELVLAALEEEGWPPRIDDPLPPAGVIDPKTRLHDTIKALNRHHLHEIVRFSGDGKGSGVQWIMVKGD